MLNWAQWYRKPIVKVTWDWDLFPFRDHIREMYAVFVKTSVVQPNSNNLEIMKNYQ